MFRFVILLQNPLKKISPAPSLWGSKFWDDQNCLLGSYSCQRHHFKPNPSTQFSSRVFRVFLKMEKVQLMRFAIHLLKLCLEISPSLPIFWYPSVRLIILSNTCLQVFSSIARIWTTIFIFNSSTELGFFQYSLFFKYTHKKIWWCKVWASCQPRAFGCNPVFEKFV